MSRAAVPAVATVSGAGRLSRPAALWLIASIFVTYLAASTVPSPLYALYREAWGFSALTLTVVFSIYAFALLGGLLFFGSLSDHVGRREVIIGALVLEFVSLLVFLHAESVGWLLAARAIQGLATGIATSALSAGMLDIHRERGSLLNSVAPLVGMGLGALGAGALAEFAPAPTRLVFDILLAVVAVQTLASFWLPETVSKHAGALAAMKPRLAVPARAWPVLWQVGPSDVSDLGIDAVSSLPSAELRDAIEHADVVVSHAGTGSILTALSLGHKPIVVPRRAAHGEHVDGHQDDLAGYVDAEGLAIVREADALTLDDLDDARRWRVTLAPDLPPVVLD